MTLLLINGEFGTFALVSEGFDFLINNCCGAYALYTSRSMMCDGNWVR